MGLLTGLFRLAFRRRRRQPSHCCDEHYSCSCSRRDADALSCPRGSKQRGAAAEALILFSVVLGAAWYLLGGRTAAAAFAAVGGAGRSAVRDCGPDDIDLVPEIRAVASGVESEVAPRGSKSAAQVEAAARRFASVAVRVMGDGAPVGAAERSAAMESLHDARAALINALQAAYLLPLSERSAAALDRLTRDALAACDAYSEAAGRSMLSRAFNRDAGDASARAYGPDRVGFPRAWADPAQKPGRGFAEAVYEIAPS